MSTVYPPELRTPPLPLVAFIGGSEHHKEVGAFFSHVLRPPIITVGIAEPHENILAKLFGPRKPSPAAHGPPPGIIKVDWFVKHRQRKASVALAIVSRSDVDGDPSTWNRMLYSLRVVRDAAAMRGAGFIVAVVQDAALPDVPPDRAAAVCGHLQLEPRLFVAVHRPANYAPTGSDPAKLQYDGELKALGRLALELSCAYYGAEVARRVHKHSVRIAQMGGSCPAELSARVAFKLAVMAEFRQEWSTAITQYQAAYAHMTEVSMGNPLSLQRHAEVTRVAEQVHFKIMMLLLHQNRYEEAVQQLQQHMAHYLTPPEPLPAAAEAAHLGWVSRQFHVAADMLRAKLDANRALAPHREASPPYLQLSAAQAGVRRRQAVERAWQSRAASPLAVDASSVKRGPYVGQVVLRADGGARDLSDSEYLLYLEAEEGKVHHTAANLELLSGALLLFKDTPSERVRCQLGVLMAQEHFLANSLPNARKLLLQVSHTYRRDGWEAPLLQVLGQLRECAQRLKSAREYVAFTLEITALPNALDAATNKRTADMALSTLRTGVSAIKASIMKPAASTSPDRHPSPRAAPDAAPGSPPTSTPTTRFDYTIEHLDPKDVYRPPAAKGDPPGDPSRGALSADLYLRHHQQDFGWWRCVAFAAGFTAAPLDPPHLDFHIALHNNLPTALPLQRLELHFTDDQGAFLALASPAPLPPDAPPSPSRPYSPPADAPPTPSSSSPAQSPAPSPRGPPTPPTSSPSAPDERPASSSSASSGAPTPTTSAPAATSGWPPEALQPLRLPPKQWQRLCVRLQPRCVGRIRAVEALMVLSDFCTLTWKLGSFPPGQASLGNLHLSLAAPPFKAPPAVLPGAFQFHVQQVGRLPSLEIQAPPLALCSEHVALLVVVTTTSALPQCELELSLKSQDPTLSAADLTLHLQDPTAPPSGAAAPAPIPIDGHRIRLPPLPAGARLPVPVFLRCGRPGRVALSATALCPAAVHAAQEVAFHNPFEYQTWFTAEASTHTLTVPAKPLPTAGGAAVMPLAGAPSRGPGSMPLTIGQPVLLTVLARALQDCALQLLEASVDLAPGSGLQLMSELRSQLDPSGAVLSQGDMHTFLLHICPTTLTSTPSIGHLRLTCRRHPPPGPTHSATAAPSAADSPQPAAEPAGGLPAPPAALETMELSLELPRAVVQDSMLTVRAVGPPQATAGIAFSFSVQVHNFTALPQELHITLTDPAGFVCEGDREQVLAVLPRDKSTVMWLLVAHSAGQLLLPAVRVAAMRYNCSVLSQRSHVYVAPF